MCVYVGEYIESAVPIIGVDGLSTVDLAERPVPTFKLFELASSHNTAI